MTARSAGSLEFHHHTPGQSPGDGRRQLRKLRTGTQLETGFRSSTDTVEIAALETHELDFMYKAGGYHFMNAGNHDQLEVDEETLAEKVAKWMSEGMPTIAEFYEGRPIGIQMPSSLTLFRLAASTTRS